MTAFESREVSVELDSSEGRRRILAGVDLRVTKSEFLAVTAWAGSGG